jgi:hypothetical protein
VCLAESPRIPADEGLGGLSCLRSWRGEGEGARSRAETGHACLARASGRDGVSDPSQRYPRRLTSLAGGQTLRSISLWASAVRSRVHDGTGAGEGGPCGRAA